ncbi:MAG: bacterial transcriptional activator domain-containing protein, partial [Caldilinea sp.]
MTNLRIQLFGGFSITLNDKEVLPGRRTSRTALLLAFLLLKRNRRQSREQLAYMFWTDSSDMQARTNLRSVLASLRKQAPALAPYLQDDDAYLCWRTGQSQEFDVDAFESALQQAALLEDADDAVLVTVLEKAVSLYAGELLPGYYEDWVLAERMRLHMAYLDALIWLVDLLEKSGHLHKAIRYAEMLLQADRLRETSHLLLMRLCAAAGDRARALAIYADCARLLVEELGVEPGPAIEQLHRHLLQDSEPENGSSPDIPSGSALVGRVSDWMQLDFPLLVQNSMKVQDFL